MTSRVLWIGCGPAPDGLPELAVEWVAIAPEALAGTRALNPHAVLAGFPLAGWTPAEVLEEVARVHPAAPVVVADPECTVADAVRLARLGAFAVLDGACGPDEMLDQLEAAVEEGRLRASRATEPAAELWRRTLVGRSRAMEDVARIIRLVGPRRSTVLITGETGTGKEMAARAIHMAGPRAALPLVAVSCAALPENLLEAELFGHVKGAFTGAVAHRVGRFEQANGGTLFLDEIGEMPLELQAKLLRVLQEREFQRLGSSETVRVDVRVVAATNVNLADRVRQGRFREDLYYRLNVVPLEMPALRDRACDIPPLALHFVEKICRAEGMPVKRVEREALERLMRHPWPGNVRQLENAVEMAVALSGDREALYAGDFAALSQPARRAVPLRAVPSIAVPDEGLDFELTVNQIERSLLEQALRKAGGNKTAAADMLRLKRTTLAAKLRSLECGTTELAALVAVH